MPVTAIIAVLGLMAPAAAAPGPVSSTQTFASTPRTCEVLQAAYTAAIGQETIAYPQDVRSSPRALGDLREFTPEYRARLPLSAQEFDDLAAREGMYRSKYFRPACDWKGTAIPSTDTDGHRTFITFTSPIFSKDGRLALVEVSFRGEGWYGHGMLCTARSSRGVWSAHCSRS